MSINSSKIDVLESSWLGECPEYKKTAACPHPFRLELEMSRGQIFSPGKVPGPSKKLKNVEKQGCPGCPGTAPGHL